MLENVLNLKGFLCLKEERLIVVVLVVSGLNLGEESEGLFVLVWGLFESGIILFWLWKSLNVVLKLGLFLKIGFCFVCIWKGVCY